MIHSQLQTIETQANCMISDYFQLYANCILVKGKKYSLIQDLQKGAYYRFETNYYYLIKSLELTSILEFTKKNNLNYKELIDFLNIFVGNDLAHFTNYPKQFPKIGKSTSTPFNIHDSIIEWSKHNFDQMKFILINLTEVGCQNIEVRNLSKSNINSFLIFLKKINTTRIRGVELIIEYNKEFTHEYLSNLLKSYPIITKIVIHNVNSLAAQKNETSIIYYIEKKLENNDCGTINKNLFKVNLSFYLESLKHNNCLHKKISIDKNGNLFNCPSSNLKLGNIKNDKIITVVNKENYKMLSNISKSKIETCEYCEYRYVCSDCRIFIENPENQFSKPLKCGYDPLTGNWEDWSKNQCKIKTFDIICNKLKK